MTSPNQFAFTDLLVPRVRELSAGDSPWFRSLWGVATLTSLQEVTESVNATWDHVLTNDGAMSDFKRSAISQIRADHGLGPQKVREKLRELVTQLKAEPTDVGRSSMAQLEQMIIRTKPQYLANWADAIDSGVVADPEFETAARAIASHLLDSGLHPEHLNGWIDTRSSSLSATELIREGTNLETTRSTSHQFALAIEEIPREIRLTLDNSIVDEATFRTMYDTCTNSRNSGALPVSLKCAIRIEVHAKDPFSALEKVREWVQRFVVRSSLALGSDSIKIDDRVVDIRAKKIRRLSPDRLVQVPTLKRRSLYASIDDSPISKQLDDALTMLAPHLQSTSGVSMATLWAACEGLLGRVNSNGHSVADRLADIVTCSFPRAEMFNLVVQWRAEGSGTAHDLISSGTNYQQMRALMGHFVADNDPGFTNSTDRAAVERMRLLDANLQGTMKRIRAYMQAAFRRLYYQRNFIMHAAKFDSISLPMTARIAPRLVAAGMDQIVNGYFARSPVLPLGLSARAAAELELVGSSGGKHVTTLLS